MTGFPRAANGRSFEVSGRAYTQSIIPDTDTIKFTDGVADTSHEAIGQARDEWETSIPIGQVSIDTIDRVRLYIDQNNTNIGNNDTVEFDVWINDEETVNQDARDGTKVGTFKYNNLSYEGDYLVIPLSSGHDISGYSNGVSVGLGRQTADADMHIYADTDYSSNYLDAEASSIHARGIIEIQKLI